MPYRRFEAILHHTTREPELPWNRILVGNLAAHTRRAHTFSCSRGWQRQHVWLEADRSASSNVSVLHMIFPRIIIKTPIQQPFKVPCILLIHNQSSTSGRAVITKPFLSYHKQGINSAWMLVPKPIAALYLYLCGVFGDISQLPRARKYIHDKKLYTYKKICFRKKYKIWHFSSF